MNFDQEFDDLNQRVNRAYNTNCFDAKDFSNWIQNLSPDELCQILDHSHNPYEDVMFDAGSVPYIANNNNDEDDEEGDEDVVHHSHHDDHHHHHHHHQHHHLLPLTHSIQSSSSSPSVFGQQMSTCLTTSSQTSPSFHSWSSPNLEQKSCATDFSCSFSSISSVGSFTSALSNPDWIGGRSVAIGGGDVGRGGNDLNHFSCSRSSTNIIGSPVQNCKKTSIDNLPTIQLALANNDDDDFSSRFHLQHENCENQQINHCDYTSYGHRPSLTTADYSPDNGWSENGWSSSSSSSLINSRRPTFPASIHHHHSNRRMKYQIDSQLFDRLDRLLGNVWTNLQSEYNQRKYQRKSHLNPTLSSNICTWESTIANNWSTDSGCADESMCMDEDSNLEDSEGEEDDERCTIGNNNVGISATPSGRKQIKLWQFLLHLLDDPRFSQVIGWLSEMDGVFRIHQTRLLSRLWGLVKGRPAMNYDKLSRSMRQYYNRRILIKPAKSTRLVYTFHPEFLLKKRYHA